MSDLNLEKKCSKTYPTVVDVDHIVDQLWAMLYDDVQWTCCCQQVVVVDVDGGTVGKKLQTDVTMVEGRAF
ncbi:Rhotekin-2 [Trichinella spiralis]|uniref:Rhotekin-2 n=1 Tax=Trichinella spiralis TaxID=6334 RepID=A0ABR3L026_TRISP